MKILVVTQVFYPEQFRINEIVPELVNMGHEVTVLTEYPNYPEGEIYEGYGFDIPYEEDYYGAKVVRLKARPRHKGKVNLALNYASFWFKGCSWVRKHGRDFDVCYCPQLSPVFMAYPCVTAKKKFKVPYILNVQDMWPESFMCVMHTNNKLIYKVLEFMSNIVYKSADKILCSSNSFIDILKIRNIPEQRLEFWPQFAEEIENKEYSCPKEYKTNYRFTFTGNVGEAQGLEKVLEAAELLKDNNDIGFYIVGDGSNRENLENIAKDKGLTNVFFTGRKPKELMPNYIKNATAGVLILNADKLAEITIPAKLQMYMTCGAPVLCAIEGESANIVNYAQCGICCEFNGESIKDAVLEFVSKDKKTLAKQGENSKNYAKEHFDKNVLMLNLNESLVVKNE